MTANQKPNLTVVEGETPEFTEAELKAAAEQWAAEVSTLSDVDDTSLDELLELASEVPDMMNELKKRALKIREQLQEEVAAKAAARKARVAELLAVGKSKSVEDLAAGLRMAAQKAAAARAAKKAAEEAAEKACNTNVDLAEFLPEGAPNFLVRFASEFTCTTHPAKVFMGLRGILIYMINWIKRIAEKVETTESHRVVLEKQLAWLQPRTDKVKAAAAAAGVDFRASREEQEKYHASDELTDEIGAWLRAVGYDNILDIPEDPGPQAEADAEAAAEKAEKQEAEQKARKAMTEKLMERLRDQFPEIAYAMAKKMANRLAKKYGHIDRVGRIFHTSSVNKAKSMLEAGESWETIQQDQSVRIYRVCADKSPEQLVRAVEYRQGQEATKTAEVNQAETEKRQAKGYGEAKKAKKVDDGKKKSKKPSKKAARKAAAAKQSS